MSINFARANKVSRVMNAVAAGTTDQTSSAVDMAGFEDCTFIAAFGALTATQVTQMKAQQSSDDGVADAYSDLEGTLTGPLADGDGNKLMVLEVYNPAKRYLKLVIDRGTANAVIDGVVAIQSQARVLPVTQPSTVAFTEVHRSPAEGTA